MRGLLESRKYRVCWHLICEDGEMGRWGDAANFCWRTDTLVDGEGVFHGACPVSLTLPWLKPRGFFIQRVHLLKAPCVTLSRGGSLLKR